MDAPKRAPKSKTPTRSVAGTPARLREPALEVVRPRIAAGTDPRPTAPLDAAVKAAMDKQYRWGTSLEAIAAQFGRSVATVRRALNEVRALRLREQKIEAMSHPSFDDPAASAAILGPMPEVPEGKGGRRLKTPDGLPPYLASLYEDPLLTREQEAHLFRKMNYLKYQAIGLRDRIDPARAKASELDEVERLLEEALAVKNQIIRANLRLVVSIAKKHIGPGRDFFELVSDGNMALIRAVEKFDYSRGNKFSTYASWAIMNRFARSIPEEAYRRDRFLTGHEEMFEAAADNRADEFEAEAADRRNREAVEGMLGKLDERERRIIVSRFGIGGAGERTLEQLGRELGITKERVRQIESRAQDKLRRFASETKLDVDVAIA